MIWLLIYFVAGVFMASRRPLLPNAGAWWQKAVVISFRVAVWPVYAHITVKAFLRGVREGWNRPTD